MSSKYSSILFKPEQFHEIGPFRLPVYHDLTPGEAKGIDEISRKQSKQTFKSIRLAQQIAKDKSITTKEAIDLMAGISEDEGQEIALEYTAELEQLQSETISTVEQQVDFVTLVLQYRGEAKIKNKWQEISDWTIEDTHEMPKKLLEELYTFILWERDGWPKEGKDEAEEKN